MAAFAIFTAKNVIGWRDTPPEAQTDNSTISKIEIEVIGANVKD